MTTDPLAVEVVCVDCLGSGGVRVAEEEFDMCRYCLGGGTITSPAPTRVASVTGPTNFATSDGGPPMPDRLTDERASDAAEIRAFMGGEGETLDDRVLLGLWKEFSTDWCAGWLIPGEGVVGNFAAWLIHRRENADRSPFGVECPNCGLQIEVGPNDQ